MAHAGEEQGDLLSGIGRDDAGGEDAGALSFHIVGERRGALHLAGQLQHLHGGIVVVEHAGLGGLIEQFLVGRGQAFSPPPAPDPIASLRVAGCPCRPAASRCG